MIEDILADWPRWGLTAKAPAVQQLRTLAGGLTNQCFLLPLERGDFVLRVEGRNSAALDINRDAELAVHQLVAAHGLTPVIRYRPPAGGYWIREYVPGRPLTEADMNATTVARMADTLQRLHQLPLPPQLPPLSISAKATAYWNMITARDPASPLLALREPAQTLLGGMPDERRSLCHMDPLPANWIRTPNDRLVLLDWEYAAQGHPLWDLAALLGSAGLEAADEQPILAAAGVADDRVWRFARAQMRYMTALWYGAQNLWDDRRLLTELQQLVTDCGA